jgi:cytochrome c oxidase subunit II
MLEGISGKSRRVLIVSSHPLFGKGLRNLLQERKQSDVEVVGILASVEEAIRAIQETSPDLVIVDYDDDRVNREEFLAHFVEGAQKLRVVLLSLKEGGSEAIVYDRRSLAASQIDDWLREWNDTETPFTASQEGDPRRKSGIRTSRASRKRLSLRQSLKSESEPDQRRTSMRHFLIAVMLVIALTALTAFGLRALPLLPTAASLQAGPIDELFNYHFLLISFLFSLIVGLMLYSIVVFRRKPGDESDAVHIEGDTRLEVIWTLAPLAAVVFFSYLGAIYLGRIETPDPRPLEVNIVASQWSWRFEYPDSQVVSDELVLPVNQQVLFRMVSTDVIHSFWVPEFRVKQDILPGGEDMIRDLRVTPNLVGDYTLRCAEMCGERHANMEAPVRVVTQNEYSAWIEEQAAAIPDSPVDRGALWARQYGCLSCHTTDGTPSVGPTWQGVYQHEVPLADGSTVIADEAYLYESITDPGAKIVAGFQNIMPDLTDQLTEEQIQDLIEFIKSLSTEQ